ncbi:restriction endonuclease subunit S [Klebsiella variicola]|uniref:restriction endonuclease subunit S n=1 Tax=Klebsiella variicola TaxID=244366 RepID=UPI001090E273|nr:restriction endonuclease subunit S [Klebsiella variicola]MBR7601992.1 restriction endonuclease subunit S [Klebsiella variicola]VGA96586.1 putative restriction endonuclease S subunit [Klebsiella variicola]HBX9940470.1 restriction endonuclease subunit S [Klebsiella variicola]
MAKYKAYPEYKDSGVEWLGAIPEDWSVTKLKYIADLLTAKSTNSDDLFVGLENISSGDGKYISKEENIADGASVSFEKNDVLFGKLRPYLAKSWLATFSGVCSSEFLVLRTAKLHPKYLNYFSLTNEFIDQVNSSTYGSKMPRASWEFIGLLPVPTCSYSLSEKVAEFLDYETAKIDNLIEKQQQLIELLKEKRQAVISHAVTKGLTPDVPMKDSGVEWLGEVPEHWRVSRIKNYAKIESGHTPSRTKPEYWVSCNIPWVSLNDSKQLKEVDYIEDTFYKISELGMANSSAHLLPARAVVFTRDASIGLSAITTKSMAVSQHLIAWICDEKFIIPEFLLLVFYAMEKEFERYTFGATIKTIGMDNVRGLKATFPPIEEQRNLIDWAFSKIEKIKSSINKVEDMLSLLQERRTALISAAVTGKIDVRDWVAPDTQDVEEPQEATA